MLTRNSSRLPQEIFRDSVIYWYSFSIHVPFTWSRFHRYAAYSPSIHMSLFNSNLQALIGELSAPCTHSEAIRNPVHIDLFEHKQA